VRAWLLHVLVRLGETECAERVLTGLGERERGLGEIRMATAALQLARDDPRAALAALAPVLDGSVRMGWRTWLVEAFLLEAIARDALGEEDAAVRALERALDQAEPNGALLFFLLHPVPGLLERHARHRVAKSSAHPALIPEIQSLLAGNGPAPKAQRNTAPTPAGPGVPSEPLSDSEIRVLRYLPTHTCRGGRSPASCTSRLTPSGPICVTYTPSSARTAARRPSSAPATLACSHPPSDANPPRHDRVMVPVCRGTCERGSQRGTLP
jgi:LuxR family transcriptional regulator, maltose regulon positive regulatory protein